MASTVGAPAQITAPVEPVVTRKRSSSYPTPPPGADLCKVAVSLTPEEEARERRILEGRATVMDLTHPDLPLWRVQVLAAQKVRSQSLTEIK